jgi:hypothetical protein
MRGTKVVIDGHVSENGSTCSCAKVAVDMSTAHPNPSSSSHIVQLKLLHEVRQTISAGSVSKDVEHSFQISQQSTVQFEDFVTVLC